MGYYLNGLTQIIAPPLFCYDGVVNRAGGEVAVPIRNGTGKPLVVSKVEICFGAIFGNVDLTVFKGTHGAGVYV